MHCESAFFPLIRVVVDSRAEPLAGDEHVFKSKLLTNLNLSSKKLADVEKAFDAIGMTKH